jgi:hypothetical protein
MIHLEPEPVRASARSHRTRHDQASPVLRPTHPARRQPRIPSSPLSLLRVLNRSSIVFIFPEVRKADKFFLLSSFSLLLSSCIGRRFDHALVEHLIHNPDFINTDMRNDVSLWPDRKTPIDNWNRNET